MKKKSQPVEPEPVQRAMELDYMNHQLARSVNRNQSSSIPVVFQQLSRIQNAGIADT